MTEELEASHSASSLSVFVKGGDLGCFALNYHYKYSAGKRSESKVSGGLLLVVLLEDSGKYSFLFTFLHVYLATYIGLSPLLPHSVPKKFPFSLERFRNIDHCPSNRFGTI